LLKKFGSVQRIRAASVEQISKVPGFGGKAAGELKAFLEARSNSPLPLQEERSDTPTANSSEEPVTPPNAN